MHIFRICYCYQYGVYLVLQLFTGMTTASGTRPHVHKKMILQYHQDLLILRYKLVQLHVLYTLTVQRWLDKTIILI